MNNSYIGILGLGVMGRNLGLNIAEKRYPVSVYNRVVSGEENVVRDFLLQGKELEGANIQGFTNLDEFVNSIASPKKIILMVPAGDTIDHILSLLIPLLSEGDIIIDGGNSHYIDTQNRCSMMKSKKLHFLGTGISGGELGARHGPSLMVGGEKSIYDKISSLFLSISSKDRSGRSCCAYIGGDGSGHFVKMVHNGIEYVEMQLLAEVYSILSATKSNSEINSIFREWNEGNLGSYLLEISARILVKKEGNQYLLDLIDDKAVTKGTGSWSAIAALKLGSVNSMISSSVFVRYLSSLKDTRIRLSKNIDRINNSEIDLDTLKSAYSYARLLNHQQGFELIRKASDHHNWDISLKEISRIWTNGCIIRSELMVKCIDYFNVCNNLFDHKEVIRDIVNYEKASQEVLAHGLANRIGLPLFSESHSYWITMTTNQLPANLIQAQRDYFGAHTYNKINSPENQFFHTDWD